jgi:hypothetical protein
VAAWLWRSIRLSVRVDQADPLLGFDQHLCCGVHVEVFLGSVGYQLLVVASDLCFDGG